jgi:hypothetical protein
VSKLYIDGCSLTYGQGLPRELSAGAQLNCDLDLSRPGKSNTAMVIDLYKNINKFDTYIIGLTYPSRYTFYNNREPFDLQPNKNNLDRLDGHPMGEFIESTYPQFYKVLWSITNDQEMKVLSDFYLNAIISLLKEQNKKYVIYSWARLNCNDPDYFFLEIPRNTQYRLPDGHLNEVGMNVLVNSVKEKLNVKE